MFGGFSRPPTDAQIGVAAQLGYLKVSQGGGFYVYTVVRTVINVG